MKKKLVRFSSSYTIEEHDGKPLPEDIYNSEGAILARKGSALPRERLANSYILVDETYLYGKPGQKVTGEQAPAPVDRSDEEISSDVISDDYEEESAEKIENYLVELDFEPIPKLKTALRSNIYSVKEIFRKKIVNNMVFLDSQNNETITGQIADYLAHIVDINLYASDYIDMLTAIRNRDNYVTFSHALSVAFYTMAIAKKMKMLREDYIVRDNLGRWLPIKTKKHGKILNTLPLSTQLLKYIDYQKHTVNIKYEGEVKETLLERINDLMYEYAALDGKKEYPSLSPAYDDAMLRVLTMAAINCDIGKLCIPNRILNKRGPLTPDEWSVMKQHPVYSVSKLKEIDVNNPRMFALIISHHIIDRENGYPAVKGNIPLETRIIMVADAYDAMTAPRHYGKIHSHAEAIENIAALRERGSIDLPLFLAAVHTFEEYNHEFIKRRNKKTTDAESSREDNES